MQGLTYRISNIEYRNPKQIRIFKILILILFSASCFALGASVAAQSALVNINTASLEELDTLPGVGPTIAQRIIDGRPYVAVEEISNVQGIGEPDSSTYDDIIDLITVGDTSGTADPTATASTSANSSSSAPVYSEINQTPVSIKLNIGKDRTGSVGSPMFFKADVNLKNIQNGDLRWNFGDGSEGYGKELYHIYEYPGEYVVVLTLGSMGGESARINVKVIEQELTIMTASPERIEIKNDSKYEADLSGKALVVGDRSFIFPQDTIIKPGASISFGSKVTGLNPTVPVAVNIFATGTTEHPKIAKRIEEEKVEKIAQIQNQLVALKQQMASITPPPVNLAVQQLSEEESSELEEPEEVEVVESQTAIAVKSHSTGSTSSPQANWFDMLKRFFLRTR